MYADMHPTFVLRLGQKQRHTSGLLLSIHAHGIAGDDIGCGLMQGVPAQMPPPVMNGKPVMNGTGPRPPGPRPPPGPPPPGHPSAPSTKSVSAAKSKSESTSGKSTAGSLVSCHTPNARHSSAHCSPPFTFPCRTAQAGFRCTL